MKEYEEQYEVCPHCGYVDGSPPAEAYHLAPGEILIINILSERR